MKNNKRIHIISILIGIIPLIAGALVYSKMPDQMIIHWDANGVPNGYAYKATALFVLPGILLVLSFFMPALLKVDPKYDNMDPKLRSLVMLIIPVVSIFCSSVTIAAGLEKSIPIPRLGTFLIGILFILIGNYLPKTKQSYTMGIKLPWTLNSEENWNRTHRMAGFLWVLGGIVCIILGFIGRSIGIITISLVIMVVIPCVYSYLLYRKGI